MITLDGSYLEGGGQILRTALALSMITQKPFKIENIRKNRPEPGLKAQHLECIRSFIELTEGKASAVGAEKGSESIEFHPAKITRTSLNIDIGTAGSITLLLQSMLPAIVFGERNITLEIKGGTDTKWSPTFDYFREVILPHLLRFAKIEAKLLKRGFYPKGGGIVNIKIKPHKLADYPEIDITTQEEILLIDGKSFASKDLMGAEVAERQARSAEKEIKDMMDNFSHIRIEPEYNDTLSTGSGITLWAILSSGKTREALEIFEKVQIPVKIGADSLGERGRKAEEIGKEAADRLIKEIKSSAPVDVHLADNLIPFLGMTGGNLKVSEISNHTLTNIYTTEIFLGKKFIVNKEEKTISCSK